MIGIHNRKDETLGRILWERWKTVGKSIGDFQARLILILFYFVVLGPFALAMRWASDPLAIKVGSPRGWRPRDNKAAAPIERSTKQF